MNLLSSHIIIAPIIAVMLYLSGAWAIKQAIERQGMTVTSWWRSPGHNARVGGVSNSRHLIGLAWDVVPVTPRNMRVLQGMGLFRNVINEGDHIHVELF